MSRKQKLLSALGIAAVLGGILYLSSGVSQAGESCQGLDTALRNNLKFIDDQRRNPDAQSAARIANRQAVVDLIQQRRKAAGCTGDVSRADPAGGTATVPGAKESCQGLDTALRNNLKFIDDQRRHPDAQSAARIANRQAVVDLIQQRRKVAGCTADVSAGNGAAPPAAAPPAAAPPNAGTGTQPAAAPPAGGAQQVCAGSTVTLSGEGKLTDEPAASSNQFPLGTRLRVTNLDNNQSTDVTVTSTSGSCVLLNNAAFERVREPKKMVIRRALIERLG